MRLSGNRLAMLKGECLLGKPLSGICLLQAREALLVARVPTAAPWEADAETRYRRSLPSGTARALGCELSQNADQKRASSFRPGRPSL